ncbi:MAG: hypothetical protein II945_00685, partial [Bacteroidales bacterium]|nr:hypothetical protein [Bacteroidales bacterium]
CFFFQSSDCLLSVLSPASISSKESTWIFAALSIYFKELFPLTSLPSFGNAKVQLFSLPSPFTLLFFLFFLSFYSSD